MVLIINLNKFKSLSIKNAIDLHTYNIREKKIMQSYSKRNLKKFVVEKAFYSIIEFMEK